jgi:hypothetical protein
MLTLTVPAVVKFNASMLRPIVDDALDPIWGEQLWLEGFLGFEPRVVKLKLTMR